MKMKVTVHRDENYFPRIIEIKRGRRAKVTVEQTPSPTGEVYNIEIEGKRDRLPSFTEVLAMVNARRLDRIGTIELVDLISRITLIDMISTISEVTNIENIELIASILRLDLIKNIEIIGNMPDLTLYGSSGVALKQTDAGAGAWQDPNGNDDPEGGWFYGAWAYDGDFDNCAYNNASAIPEWTTPLHLETASISSNKLRFYAKTEDGLGETAHKIDIDVLRNGVWIHVYEGHFAEEVWIEKSYPQGTITEARIRFYSVAKVMSLCEFDFWQVPATGGEMKVVLHAWTGTAWKEVKCDNDGVLSMKAV